MATKKQLEALAKARKAKSAKAKKATKKPAAKKTASKKTTRKPASKLSGVKHTAAEIKKAIKQVGTFYLVEQFYNADLSVLQHDLYSSKIENAVIDAFVKDMKANKQMSKLNKYLF